MYLHVFPFPLGRSISTKIYDLLALGRIVLLHDNVKGGSDVTMSVALRYQLIYQCNSQVPGTVMKIHYKVPQAAKPFSTHRPRSHLTLIPTVANVSNVRPRFACSLNAPGLQSDGQ